MEGHVINALDPAKIRLLDGRVLSYPQMVAEHNQILRHNAGERQRIEAYAKEHGLKFHAAADAVGPGFIEVPRFDNQITDAVRRRGALGQRIAQVPANGAPHRWIEQKTIARGNAVDPRNIAGALVAESPRRVERYATIKAYGESINFGYFDNQVAQQQGVFPSLPGKDLQDGMEGLLTTVDEHLWTGADTGLTDQASLQLCGLITQINRTAHIDSTASIVAGLGAEASSIRRNRKFQANISAFYADSETIQLICDEEGQNGRQIKTIPLVDRDMQSIGGLTVVAIAGGAGTIALIEDWSLPSKVASASEAGKYDYTVVALSEKLVEWIWIGSPDPQIFVLGLGAQLATQYVLAQFGTVLAKGKADIDHTPETTPVTYAHSVITITR